MNVSHRERVAAVLRGERPDRVPVALWRHFPGDDQDPESLAAAVIAFQREFDFDLIKVTPASSYSVRDWGVRDVWEGDPEGVRRYVDRAIHSPRDWGRLKPLDIRRGALGAQLECLRLIVRESHGTTPVLQTIFNPLAQARHLAGDEPLLEHMRRWPEAVAGGLETITRVTAAFVGACLEAGADGIFLASQHASFRLLSAEEYLRFGRPYDLRLLHAAGPGWLNMLHLHGESVMFSELCDYPVHVLNWHDREAGPSLKDGWRASHKVVCGGWEQWQTIVRGDPQRVRDQARDAVHQMAGRNLILGTGCVAPIVAPRANLLAAARAGDADKNG
jgi:uroporphyrinogen decarboxylase